MAEMLGQGIVNPLDSTMLFADDHVAAVSGSDVGIFESRDP
jgi:hypothetical protein